MRSSRYASLTRLLIGASIIAGLFGTTASVALAASPATFAVLREETPHNGVQSIDQVYRATDTVTGTGDLATGFTVDLSATSPAQTASLQVIAPTGGPITTGTFKNVAATPTDVLPGAVLTIDGTVCVSGLAEVRIGQVNADISALSLMFEGTCPAAGFGEVHAQIAIAATVAVKAVATSPTNTLAIGNVVIGNQSSAHAVTFTNIGNTVLDMSTLAKGGRFPTEYVFTKTCGASLAVGASCTASMVFKPTTFDLEESAVTLADDDISGDGLSKEVLVTATGLVVDASNTTPGTAIDINTAQLPFYSGVQVQTVSDTHSGCGPDNRGVWYHVKSTTTKTLALTTLESDTATSLELYNGPVSGPVFVKCGVADAQSHDSLTFTAAANTDYFVRLSREGSDYALVLKAALGSPDTMVDASGFALNYGTFYPVVDTYRDAVTISGNRGETASASISIYNPSGTRVRILSIPSGLGAYSTTWNGKNTAGTLQGNGKYKVVTTVTDTSGNHLSDTRYITLSTKKLVTKTFTQTIDGAKTSSLVKTGTGSASKTATAYTGGLKLTSGANGTVAASYSFVVPSAISYSTVSFTAIGKYTTNTMLIGLQNWTVCGTYSVTCITAIHGGPHSSSVTSASVSSPASTGLLLSIHRVRGYIYAPALPGTTRTLDVRDVKVTVTYKVLG